MSDKKKRIVIGDYVHSKSDGERHYINAIKLCELYRFDPKECILAETKRPETLLGLDNILPRFSVRHDGDYYQQEVK